VIKFQNSNQETLILPPFLSWDFGTKFGPRNEILNGELYIILKLRILEVEEHFSFFNYFENIL